jgi:hypothetical protein
MTQIGGDISRVSARRFRSEFAADPLTRALTLSYVSLFLEHVTQSAVCNRVHTIEQRLSKWLLLVRDRMHAEQFRLSHDFLAKILGIQRSGVTLAVGVLTDRRILNHSRQQIEVRDAEALNRCACECYALMLDKLNDYRKQLRQVKVGSA